MEIKNLVTIYDDVIPLNVLSNLIKFANTQIFEEAEIGGGEESTINFDVRRTYVLPLSNGETSMSRVHWYNVLFKTFKIHLSKYKEDNNLIDFSYKKIFDISILKYENTGFYNWHVDHFYNVPRTMSCILLLNNDYEGGNLCFRNPDGSGEWTVDVKANRMIVWPSTFLYPHTVKPVTKGKRYSVVAWAL